jgi:hypothetical protein
MPKRETVFASAILAALVPVMVLSVGLHHAQGAADNCLAKPNAAPPQGSHWYYRVDQAGNRRCWFLAPEGAWPRQALSPKPAPNPPPKRASQPKATATAQSVAREMDPAATYAMLSPALPTSVNVVDGERASASNDAAGGLAAMHPEDDMPLIGPVLSAAELAAAEWPPGLAPHACLCRGRAGARHDRPQSFQIVCRSTASLASHGTSRAMERGIAGDASGRAGLPGIRRHGRGAWPSAAPSQVGCSTAHRRDRTPAGG